MISKKMSLIAVLVMASLGVTQISFGKVEYHQFKNSTTRPADCGSSDLEIVFEYGQKNQQVPKKKGLFSRGAKKSADEDASSCPSPAVLTVGLNKAGTATFDSSKCILKPIKVRPHCPRSKTAFAYEPLSISREEGGNWEIKGEPGNYQIVEMETIK